MTEVFNRAAGRREEIPIYRSGAMRLLLETRPGRLLISGLGSRPGFSTLVTAVKRLGWSRRDIGPLVEQYRIPVEELDRPVEAYRSFAEFFTRRLRPGARPICGEEEAIASPVDGQLTVSGRLEADAFVPVKGATFRLDALLGRPEIARRYSGGAIAIAYLAPHDCHRIHYPLDCDLLERYRLGHRLFSVSGASLGAGFRPFDRNARVVNRLVHGRIGEFLLVEVGAFYVGRIFSTDGAPGFRRKGQEKGYFGLGGSTVILLFAPGAVTFDADLLAHSAERLPTLVRAGERIGAIAGGGRP